MIVNQDYSGSIPDSSVMEKFFIKVSKDDEPRVRKALNVIEAQFSKSVYKGTDDLVFSVCCNVMKQKALYSILNDWNVLYEVINVN